MRGTQRYHSQDLIHCVFYVLLLFARIADRGAEGTGHSCTFLFYTSPRPSYDYINLKKSCLFLTLTLTLTLS